MPTNMPAKPAMPSKPAPPMRPDSMPSSKGHKVSIASLLLLLVGLVAGYGAGRVSTGTPVNPLSGGGGSYQDGYNAAKKKLDAAHVFPPAITSATALSGTVKSVGADSLVVTVALNSPNPLDEMTAPMDRSVTVTADTKIVKQVPKTADELQKDFEAFQKAAGGATTSGTPLTPPSNFKQVSISLKDLKAGDTVAVSADHDILNQTSFTATEIDLDQSILPQGAPAPAPTPAPAQNAPPAPTSTP